MSQARVSVLIAGTLALAALLGSAPTAATQQAVEKAAPPQQQAPLPVPISQDARETRQELEAILKKLPPTVARVLRTDPSLMRNQSYLATYPALAAFLQQHPEVANNAAYYLENVTEVRFWYPPQPRDAHLEAISMWRNFFEFIAISFIVAVIAGGVLWLARAALQHRRWQRAFKMQAEVHAKLLDRFTSNEELLAYIQTPAGQRLFESAPMPIDTPTRPPAAPFNRILWSIQAGIVLAAGAVGLLFVSRRLIEEIAQVFFAAGVLALAIGAGFVVSAAASLLLSRRLGLLGAAPREHAGAQS
jgi:hypothetical protein